MATTARWATRPASTIRTRPGSAGSSRVCAQLRRQRHRADPRLHEPRARQRDGRGLDPRLELARAVQVRRRQGRHRLPERLVRPLHVRATAVWPSTSATARSNFVRSPEAPTTIWDGKWHNAAGTFDGYDGAPVHRRRRGRLRHARPARPSPTTRPTAAASSATTAATCDLFLVGDVDGVQIWSRALPVADIWRFLKALFTTSR